MAEYIVLLEGAILVEDVEEVDKAIDIALDKAKKTTDKADIEIGFMDCPVCSEPLDSVCIFAKKALVGLIYEQKINAETKEKAETKAKNQIDLKNLKTLDINQD